MTRKSILLVCISGVCGVFLGFLLSRTPSAQAQGETTVTVTYINLANGLGPGKSHHIDGRQIVGFACNSDSCFVASIR